MNYVNVVEEHLMIIEEAAGQVNPFHNKQLHNSKQSILDMVADLESQVRELTSEIQVLNSIQKEGN